MFKTLILIAGVYLYSNQRGCDGGRLYFDGGALVVQNGRLLQQAPQFSVCDVEVGLGVPSACLYPFFVRLCVRGFESAYRSHLPYQAFTTSIDS